MPLGDYRPKDKTRLQITRVILPERGGKEIRLRVGKKDILIELSVEDVALLGEVEPGDWVEVILHSLVEHAGPGMTNKYIVESGWANGRVEGRVDEILGGRWGGIIFDMGNGLKSYVDMDIDAGFDDSQIGREEWWRFEFSLPHQCMMIHKAEPPAE